VTAVIDVQFVIPRWNHRSQHIHARPVCPKCPVRLWLAYWAVNSSLISHFRTRVTGVTEPPRWVSRT